MYIGEHCTVHISVNDDDDNTSDDDQIMFL